MELYKETKKSFPIIEKLFDADSLCEFKNTKILDLCLYHFGLGSWIRNNLLSPNDNLYSLFLENGIDNPDEMSDFIIRLFHYYLCSV